MTLPAPRALLSTAVAAIAVFAIVAAGLWVARGRESAATPPTVAADSPAPQAAAVLARDPENPRALSEVALASLARARETGDPSWYGRAEEAATAALASDPGSFEAMDALGTLALGRHRFAEALEWSDRSLAAAPSRVAPLGIRGDALIELGRYDEGFAAVERRLALSPDLASYSRASYWRELIGDRPGAIRLMQLAVGSAAQGSEPRAWSLVQLGLLRLGGGDAAGAERDMRRALAERPGDARALAGLARVDAAEGRLARAAAGYSAAIDRMPLPEYAAALAEVEQMRGRPQARGEAVALFDGMQDLLRANGSDVDLDVARARADLARPSEADVALARRAHAGRPGIVGDQVLGWVLTRAGRCDEALPYARRSLRLGTRDAAMLLHAGMAASCAGAPAEARRHLQAALALGPALPPLWRQAARTELAKVTR